MTIGAVLRVIVFLLVFVGLGIWTVELVDVQESGPKSLLILAVLVMAVLISFAVELHVERWLKTKTRK